MNEKNEKKELRKTIRFTPKQLEFITNKADALGMNFSEYILYASLNKKLSTKKIPVYKNLISQLAKIGGNLNQIAKACNTKPELNKHIATSLVLAISKLQDQLSIITQNLKGAQWDDL